MGRGRDVEVEWREAEASDREGDGDALVAYRVRPFDASGSLLVDARSYGVEGGGGMASGAVVRCRSCEYQSEELDDGSRRYGVNRAIHRCASCREIVAVLVDAWKTSRQPVPDPEKLMGLCPRCLGTDHTPHAHGDPCPRCSSPTDLHPGALRS